MRGIAEGLDVRDRRAPDAHDQIVGAQACFRGRTGLLDTFDQHSGAVRCIGKVRSLQALMDLDRVGGLRIVALADLFPYPVRIVNRGLTLIAVGPS